MARADKLLNMKMPKKPMAEEELDADLEGEELELEAPEEDDEMGMEEGAMEGGGLADFEDKDLLEEAIARGLLPEDFEMPELEEGIEEGDELFEEEEALDPAAITGEY